MVLFLITIKTIYHSELYNIRIYIEKFSRATLGFLVVISGIKSYSAFAFLMPKMLPVMSSANPSNTAI